MRKRNAFMEGYKKTAPFADNLNEFDEAREVVTRGKKQASHVNAYVHDE